MRDDLLIGSRAVEHGFEFHFSAGASPDRSLCGMPVEPTQIPAHFFGVDGALEGRWCQQCEVLGRKPATLREL